MSKREGLSLVLPAALAATAALAVGVRIWTRRIEARHPPQGRMIDVDGVPVHVTERGAGPAILLLHGNGATLEDMLLSGLTARLGRNHRVIALDRPGFGHSPRSGDRRWNAETQAELFWAALDSLGVDDAIIVGQSWGALAAVAMGLARPERTAGLVLVSGYYYPRDRLRIGPCALFALPILGPLMRHTVAPVISAIFSPAVVRQIFAPAEVPEHFREFPLELAFRPSQLRASAEDCANMTKDARRMQRHYGQLRMPVAILFDREDAIIDQTRQSILLHEDIPGSRLYEVQRGGHMLHHILPEQVVRAVAEIRAAAAPVAGAAKIAEIRPA